MYSLLRKKKNIYVYTFEVLPNNDAGKSQQNHEAIILNVLQMICESSIFSAN